MNNTPKLHPAVAALITIILIGVATGVVAAVNGRPATSSVGTDTAMTSTSSTNDTSPAASSSSTTPSMAGTGSANYKDGQYNVTSSYQTPGGTESIDVTLTLAGNSVSAVDISQRADSRESQEYQMMFASAYKSRVVGKKINDINLSRVAGSSLTTLGFTDALDQIKQNAAA